MYKTASRENTQIVRDKKAADGKMEAIKATAETTDVPDKRAI
jgi:hypothetical protein